MKINYMSREFDKKETYKLTKASEPLKNLEDGFIIEYDGYMEFTDKNSRGEELEILAVLDKNGKAYAGQSATFKREFKDIIETFGAEVGQCPNIKIIHGTTKAGREFVSCTIE